MDRSFRVFIIRRCQVVLKHGYIQIYTGDGKGKTTASLGLAMRALGRGWKVLIVMFTKGGNDYGELVSFANLCNDMKDNVKIVQAGLDRVVYSSNLTDEDKSQIQQGWEIATTIKKICAFERVSYQVFDLLTDSRFYPWCFITLKASFAS